VRLKLLTGPFSPVTYCTADGDKMNFLESDIILQTVQSYSEKFIE